MAITIAREKVCDFVMRALSSPYARMIRVVIRTFEYPSSEPVPRRSACLGAYADVPQSPSRNAKRAEWTKGRAGAWGTNVVLSRAPQGCGVKLEAADMAVGLIISVLGLIGVIVGFLQWRKMKKILAAPFKKTGEIASNPQSRGREGHRELRRRCAVAAASRRSLLGQACISTRSRSSACGRRRSTPRTV